MNNAHINQLMHTLKFEYVSMSFSLCNVKLKRNLNELSDLVKAFNPPWKREILKCTSLDSTLQYVSFKKMTFFQL